MTCHIVGIGTNSREIVCGPEVNGR